MKHKEEGGSRENLDSGLPENLDETFRIIENRTNLERGLAPGNLNRVYRLDRMAAICALFDNPQNRVRSIHIAGSKGKGSTAAFLGAILHAKGQKVGIYSSPHLVDYRERFCIVGYKGFPENEALAVAQDIFRELIHLDSTLPGEGGATTFEILTLMSFMLFERCGCDIAVVETGLGGRLDATNVIRHPEATIITRLEKEHVEILGRSIFQIAREKAGILKNGTPAWFGRQDFLASLALRYLSLRQGIKARTWRQDVRKIRTRGGEWEICWRNGGSTRILAGIPGRVQAENAALALTVAKTLFPDLRTGSEKQDIHEKVLEAIKNTRLPGRFEFLRRRHPVIVADGAHTPASVQHLIREFRKLPGSIREDRPERAKKFGRVRFAKAPVLIFGCMQDKRILKMAQILCGWRCRNFGTIIITSPGGARAANLEYVASLFLSTGSRPIIVEDPSEALKTALEIVVNNGGGGAILVTGSFYLAGELSRTFREDYGRSPGNIIAYKNL